MDAVAGCVRTENFCEVAQINQGNAMRLCDTVCDFIVGFHIAVVSMERGVSLAVFFIVDGSRAKPDQGGFMLFGQ